MKAIPRLARALGGSGRLICCVVLVSLPLAARGEAEPEEAPERCLAEAKGVRLCYRSHAWTSERLEEPADGLSPTRPWPIATMELDHHYRIDDVELPSGRYAWVCDADPDHRPTLELRRLRLPEGSLPDPEAVDWVAGERVWNTPFRFDTSLGLSPRLTISLTPGRGGVRLEVRYGEGQVVRDLLRDE